VQLSGLVWHEPMAMLSGDNVRLILIGITLLALAALGRLARPRGQSRGYRWKRGHKRSALRSVGNAAESGASPRPEPEFDATAQMQAIAPFQFETQPLLNEGETRLLYLLERVAADIGGGFRVMAQTSLGEVIRPRPSGGPSGDVAQAYRAINSKRLDLAVFNRFGKLVVGVEYQGHGHYRETAFMRDAIKREVLRKAGVPMLEVPAEYQPAKIAAEVHEILSAHRALLRPAEDAPPRGPAAKNRPAAA
jgi:hypothetical protein